MRLTCKLATLASALVLAFVLQATPALAATVPAKHFQTAENCGCHTTFVTQWQESMHAQALTDPIYLAKLADANRATDGKIGPFCEGCHGPIARIAGELTAKRRKFSPQAGEGITCDFCHQLTGTKKPIANASWVLKADGVKRAQLKDAKSPAHKTQYSKFHESSELCGTCHNVNHPVNNLPLEATFTEWKNGPYAKEGIQCQDCHMTPGPGVTKPNPGNAAAFGPDREHIYIMTFVGGNVALGPSELAEERLKAATKLDVGLPEIVEGGSRIDVATTITNVGAGHYVPTGLTEVRQMWLEVVATNSDGVEIMRGRRDFGTVLRDAKGRYPAELWDAVAIQSDDRIPPRESKTQTYTLDVPDVGPITVRAALYYRSCPEELAKKAKVDVPTTTMAEVTKVAYTSEAEKQAANRQALGLNGALSPPEAGGGALLIGMTTLFFVVLGGVLTMFMLRQRRKEDT